jgi:hypothetical protein
MRRYQVLLIKEALENARIVIERAYFTAKRAISPA